MGAAPSQAQTPEKLRKVGVLGLGTESENEGDVQAFRERMAQLGYVDGRNLLIESRFARSEGLPALAADLVRLKMDVIVTIGTPAAQAAKAATATIPIVMAGSGDPVGLGLVASLSHPGANVTGVTHHVTPGFAVKQLQLLKEAVPKISRVAIIKVDHPIEDAAFRAMELAAPQLGVVPVVVVLDASNPSDVRPVLTQARPDALFVFPNSTNNFYAAAIATFAAENRLPTMYGARGRVARGGGLMSYAVDWRDLRQHAAVYVDKVFKGIKPADLPVEGPVAFEMVVNLKTARALGITIPRSVLLQATEVID